MGEKYCGVTYRYPWGEELARARLRDPSGPGYPPENLSDMRQWGVTGQRALGQYLDRPASTITALSSDVRSLWDGAGDGSAERIGLGRDTVERINAAYDQTSMQTAQGQAVLQMLDREGIPSGELASVGRASARNVKQAVSDQIVPLESLADRLFGTVEDAALGAIGTQVDAAFNRLSELAYQNASTLHRAIFDRGLGDLPDTEAM